MIHVTPHSFWLSPAETAPLEHVHDSAFEGLVRIMSGSCPPCERLCSTSAETAAFCKPLA